jgi:hypothetical protein
MPAVLTSVMTTGPTYRLQLKLKQVEAEMAKTCFDALGLAPEALVTPRSLEFGLFPADAADLPVAVPIARGLAPPSGSRGLANLARRRTGVRRGRRSWTQSLLGHLARRFRLASGLRSSDGADRRSMHSRTLSHLVPTAGGQEEWQGHERRRPSVRKASWIRMRNPEPAELPSGSFALLSPGSSVTEF